MNEEQNNISEVDLDAFRARLMELKGQHEAIEREMDSIQSQMEGTGADDDGGEPLSFPDPSADLAQELEGWKNKYQRALADYQNFQQRSIKNEAEARKQGVRSVAESLVPVLDNFDLALAGDPSSLTVEIVLKGILVTRDELLRVLGTLGMTTIEPVRGDEFEPMRHEAVMQQADEEVEPGCIVAVFQKGYTLADRTIRPSKVSVRPAEDASGNETSEGNDNADV